VNQRARESKKEIRSKIRASDWDRKITSVQVEYKRILKREVVYALTICKACTIGLGRSNGGAELSGGN